ncbi:WhiB family transcriptional regulator [Auraticoccus sp. F435]|uniref:Transcriptional regulator WhiB n=1 Tax=Auraticoccus cholistanensis TaxID=2656650 RepID=A0A6A9UYY5_9ACTN|nr:WhiB family transcriptional regulator [Auraticoccus cholistanensis]
MDGWAALAKCRGTKDSLFVEGAEQRKARTLCRGCPVRLECLAEALDNRIEWGVWGGLTERERRQLLKTRTEVTSWRQALAAS